MLQWGKSDAKEAMEAMLTEHGGQIIFVVLLALLLVFLLPMLQSRTGKSLGELFFGSGRGFLRGKPGTPRVTLREPRINNGTKGELTAFIARLLRFANGHGMALVVPGSVRHDGQTASITAILVAPARIIGVRCLGFGGQITPAGGSSPWTQHINGQDVKLENPAAIGQKQQRLLQAAASRAKLAAPAEVVTVFTNARASFPDGLPDGFFPQDRFFAWLKEEAEDLDRGSLDVRAASLVLAELAGIKRKK